jgi:hypothetical protein
MHSYFIYYGGCAGHVRAKEPFEKPQDDTWEGSETRLPAHGSVDVLAELDTPTQVLRRNALKYNCVSVAYA